MRWGVIVYVILIVLENTEQLLLEKKQSLLKQTQKKLSDGTAINPINVAIESKNQGGFQTKILIRDHEIISDQPFGFNGQNKGPKPFTRGNVMWRL